MRCVSHLARRIGFVLKIIIPGFGGSLDWRIRSRRRIGYFAQFQEHREGLVVLAPIADFEAMLEGEDAGGVGQAAKSDGGEDGSRPCGVAQYFAGLGHLQLETGGLNSPSAQQTPASGGHGLDQECFLGITRLKLEDERGGKFVVAAH